MLGNQFGYWLWFTIVVAFLGGILWIINANNNWGVQLGANFASKFKGFVSNHQNNSKHIETPYVKGVWWRISPLFGWCGLQMCFELVVDIICKSLLFPSWQKHFLSVPTSQIEIMRIFPLLESSHHFAYVISKFKILKLNFFNKNWPLDPHIGCYKTF
jgi:hypothetical protein